MRRTIQSILARNDHDVVVCDFLAPCVNLNRKVDSPSILFQHNVESLIWERHYRTASNPVKRAFLYNQFRRMVRFEGAWLRKFDEVVAVSEPDRQAMSERFGINNVRCVPTGVDGDYFSPFPAVQQNPRELIFTGSMDYMPNEDAILYFANAILPGIASVLDDVTLTVAGRNPTPKLQGLARSNPRIRLTGSVPDIRPYLARAACFVVPIRIGGGTRLKIFEAMSMARPIVSTSLGAEGLPVSSGIHLEIADDPKAFAFQVVKLLTDPRQARSLAERAREFVTQKFTWESAAAEFVRICEEVLSRSRAQKAA
jgi:glycosyltransferase involved in cell wall biosynthesis